MIIIKKIYNIFKLDKHEIKSFDLSWNFEIHKGAILTGKGVILK